MRIRRQSPRECPRTRRCLRPAATTEQPTRAPRPQSPRRAHRRSSSARGGPPRSISVATRRGKGLSPKRGPWNNEGGGRRGHEEDRLVRCQRRRGRGRARLRRPGSEPAAVRDFAGDHALRRSVTPPPPTIGAPKRPPRSWQLRFENKCDADEKNNERSARNHPIASTTAAIHSSRRSQRVQEFKNLTPKLAPRRALSRSLPPIGAPKQPPRSRRRNTLSHSWLSSRRRRPRLRLLGRRTRGRRDRPVVGTARNRARGKPWKMTDFRTWTDHTN